MSRLRTLAVRGALLLAVVPPACGGAVSNHDNRIFTTAASAKLSTTDLAASYIMNPAATNDLYRGHALEISGIVATIEQASNTIVMVGPDPVVWASVHDDVAAEVLKSASPGQRITLKCFCEGLNTQVRLKSCVLPDSSR